MPEPNNINLALLMTEPCEQSGHLIYQDENLKRMDLKIKAPPSIDIEILTDFFGILGIQHQFFSVGFSARQNLHLTFPDVKTEINSQGIFLTDQTSKNMLWFPQNPVIREYDDSQRIIQETPSNFEYEHDSDRFNLIVKRNTSAGIEFPVVLFTKHVRQYFQEICSPQPVELSTVGKAFFFNYSNVNDFWNYFIRNRIFNNRHKQKQRAWQCQQLAHSLYNHLQFLENQTQKNIYTFLRDMVAYSVMLSLPDNGRWRHGVWTDIMETHARFQAEGIHLLLSQYQKTKNQIFLEKAKTATKYLLTIKDELSDGNIWYLHDSLELNEKDVTLYYKPLLRTGVWGKSISNTLCLNTHIMAMSVLYRMNNVVSDGKYNDLFTTALDSLKKILAARQGQIIFSLLYRLHDFSLYLSRKSKITGMKKIHHEFNKVLKIYLLPALKKRFPRLNMPNGFLERDLCHSVLFEYYHLVNLKDLLILYNLAPGQWLRNIIIKSMSHTIKRKRIKYFALEDPRAIVFIDILCLYSILIDSSYSHFLADYFAYFKNLNLPLSADLLSHPLMEKVSAKIHVRSDDGRLFYEDVQIN